MFFNKNVCISPYYIASTCLCRETKHGHGMTSNEEDVNDEDRSKECETVWEPCADTYTHLLFSNNNNLLLNYRLLFPFVRPLCYGKFLTENTCQTKWLNDIGSNNYFFTHTYSFTHTCTGAEGLLQREPSVLDSAFFPGRATCMLTLSMEVQLRQPEWMGVGENQVAMMHRQWRMVEARTNTHTHAFTRRDKDEERHQCGEIKWCKATRGYWQSFQRSKVLAKWKYKNNEQNVAWSFLLSVLPISMFFLIRNWWNRFFHAQPVMLLLLQQFLTGALILHGFLNVLLLVLLT